MCADRLSVGEAPACVQACPHQAIKIRTVNCEEIIQNSETDELVPGAPDVHLTLPTTRYNTNRVLPRNLLPDDCYLTKSLHAHFPLVFMLTLTQMVFGIFATNFFFNQLNTTIGAKTLFPIDAFGFLGLVTGLSVAILHLGRPLKAYRAMAGPSNVLVVARDSWLQHICRRRIRFADDWIAQWTIHQQLSAGLDAVISAMVQPNAWVIGIGDDRYRSTCCCDQRHVVHRNQTPTVDRFSNEQFVFFDSCDSGNCDNYCGIGVNVPKQFGG